jgi:hypothetical protein
MYQFCGLAVVVVPVAFVLHVRVPMKALAGVGAAVGAAVGDGVTVLQLTVTLYAPELDPKPWMTNQYL